MLQIQTRRHLLTAFSAFSATGLLGAANSVHLTMWYTAFAALGIVLGAAYLLWLYQRVFWGPNDNPKNHALLDMNGRELATLLPLVAIMFWIGIAPNIFFEAIKESVDYIVRQVDPGYFDRQPMTYPSPTTEHVAEVRK